MPHLDHADHSPSTGIQSWHGWRLHGCISSVLRGSHGLPPGPGWFAIPRLRVWEPLPQVREQDVHTDQSNHPQSFEGHARW